MTNTETLEQITRRIVEGFHPQRLILFGSRARGDERRDSDVDLLIVAPKGLTGGQLARLRKIPGLRGMITFDGLFLGRLGADVLAGVSLAFPFVMLIQHTAASGMGGGVSSAIARA